jgi:hypothetical protein
MQIKPNTNRPETGRRSALLFALSLAAASPTWACGVSDNDLETHCTGTVIVMRVGQPGAPTAVGSLAGSTMSDTDIGTCETICEVPLQPLPEPIAECTTTGLRVHCEAWPRGQGLTYRWTTSSDLTQPAGTDERSPRQEFDCVVINGAARVVLEVFAPFALPTSSRRSFSVSCSALSGAQLVPQPLPVSPPLAQ